MIFDNGKQSLGVGVYISDVQKKRRRRRFYFVLIFVLVVVYAVFLLTSWTILKSPFFHIEKITVSGNETVSNDEIFSLLWSRIFEGAKPIKALLGFYNILIWPKNLSRNDLVFLPTIKNLEIEKNYKDRSLIVKITERKQRGIWCFEAQNYAEHIETSAEDSPRESASCWWFDDEGVIFKRSLVAEGSLIMAVKDYSQKGKGLNSLVLPQEFMSNLLSIFKVLKASDLSIKEIKLNDIALQEVEVETYDGPKLLFSLRFSASNALPVIQDFYAKAGFRKLQYLDFRVENRAYYK